MKRNLLLLALLIVLSVVANSVYFLWIGPVRPAWSPVDLQPVKREVQGMTWGVAADAAPAGTVVVACEGQPPRADGGTRCDTYRGDTSCDAVLPLLCLRAADIADPLSTPGRRRTETEANREFYAGWSKADVATSTPRSGRALTSPDTADAICVADLGPGWRMAEFHDGGGGWGLRGRGSVTVPTRLWVRISDQPANCWNP